MAAPDYAGVAVTPFVGKLPVGPTNPIPVTPVAPYGGAPLFKAILPAAGFAAGENLLVAAVAGFKIRVLSINLDLNNRLSNVFFQSDTAGTQISATRVDISLWQSDATLGLFETAAGKGLYLVTSIAAASGSINISYQLVA